jgi:hypothetical protein
MAHAPEETVRLTNGIVDVEVSIGFGPRVLRYGRLGKRNVCGQAPGLFTDTALGRWHPIGGHRLWVAPETIPGSYAPDMQPVECTVDGLRAEFTPLTDAAGIQKVLSVSLDESGTRMVVTHGITNRTHWPVRVAPWAITIVDPSGTAVLPQPEYRPHSEQVLPVQPLVQWAYTDLTDSRWQIGRRLIRLTPDRAKPEPQKIGAASATGWCAVVYDGEAFIKQTSVVPGAQYPDLGCTIEFFTAGDYMEMETLAPLELLNPGAQAVHVEVWRLADGLTASMHEQELERGITAAITD